MALWGNTMAKWTKEEKRLVFEQYGKRPIHELAATLGRTPRSIYRKAGHMRHAGQFETPRHWKPEDITLLRNLYGTQPSRVIAEILGRSDGAIRTKAIVLGLTKRRNAVYEDREDCIASSLEDIIDGVTWLARTKGLTHEAIAQMVLIMRSDRALHLVHKNPRWTLQDWLDYLQKDAKCT